MKKNFTGFPSQDIVSKIQETVLEKKAEVFKKMEQNSHENMYKRIVDEAVMLIKSMWLDDAENESKLLQVSDFIEVVAEGAFYITNDLEIYSEFGNSCWNPETGCCCFYNLFAFNSQEEKEKYIKEVIAQLPKGTVYETSKYSHLLGTPCIRYTFKLKVNIK